MPRRRRATEDAQGRPIVLAQHAHGVAVTDPAGRLRTEPFTGDANQVLTGDGVFTTLPDAALNPPAWGTITGDLRDQTDLAAALDAKQDLLVYSAALCAYVISDV